LPNFAGRNYHIEVNGEVEVSATNLTPKLTVQAPQGSNPRVLMLDLTIESGGGLGGPIMIYKKVEYTRPTSGNQYDEVDIMFDGQIIQRIEVGHPKTFAKTSAKKPAKKKAKNKSVKAKKKKAGKKKRL
jgi:hypothetical protein